MSLLGIDVGTSGCKAVAFSYEGVPLASAYDEYDIQRKLPGYAELDTYYVWEKVKNVIRSVASNVKFDPIRTLAVSSLGEAVVPVTMSRDILGPSILNFDQRGEEFLPELISSLDNFHVYRINGNTVGNQYSLTKLLWLKKYQPVLYAQSDQFLHWSGFISFMLGADPAVDYSLANRTLLFDVARMEWSDEVMGIVGLNCSKLPKIVPSGVQIGKVSRKVASELGLPTDVTIVSGSHDQCANALGSGVIEDGQALLGMGTFMCITPVYSQRKEPTCMVRYGLNTEHHAVPTKYVSFLYNTGGALLKWYRDTFAVVEKKLAHETGRDIYVDLIAEVPVKPSSVLVLPHFSPTGPPEFIMDSSGTIIGLKLETTRGDILKGILEGITYYLRENVESLPETGIFINEYRAVGGGSKSDTWVQMCADILNSPISRPATTEAGALGAAILSGIGYGIYNDVTTAVQNMVKVSHTFIPDPSMADQYNMRYHQYQKIWPTMKDLLKSI